MAAELRHRRQDLLHLHRARRRRGQNARAQGRLSGQPHFAGAGGDRPHDGGSGLNTSAHSREGGNPDNDSSTNWAWIPAFAGVSGGSLYGLTLFHRHHRRVFRIAQRERGLHVTHVGRGGEFLDKGLEGFQVGRHAFEHEVDLAREHPALAHQRLGAHEILEGNEIRLGLARQMHHREDGHLIAELLFVEQSAVALDIARLLQRADAAQARRRRDSDATRQLHVGDAAVLLQLLEDLAVDGVESGGHKGTPQTGGRIDRGSFIPRNNISRNNIAHSTERDRVNGPACGCDGLRILHSSAGSHTSGMAEEPARRPARLRRLMRPRRPPGGRKQA